MQAELQSGTTSGGASYQLLRAGPEHEALLLRLYVSKREQELLAWGWDGAQRQQFLELQWRARNASYAAAYPDALDQIVLSGGSPVGRLLTCQVAYRLRLLDIALLPEHCGRGLGTRLLRDLQRACASRGQSIELHVALDNPSAGRLYARLGFRTAGTDPIYARMEWPAS